MGQNRQYAMMSRGVAALLSLAVLCASAARGEQATGSTDAAPGEVVFVPPDAGAPADRVGAGTRDLARDHGALVLLAPEGGGLTRSAQPALVWYLSENFKGSVQAQIVPVEGTGTGVARMSEGPLRKGYYALDLARSQMTLEPGKIYEWKVLLLTGPDGDVIADARTYVERQPGGLQTGDDPAALAAAGLWFDALGAFVRIGLSGRVRIEPGPGFAGLVSSAGITGLPGAE
ncbi:DUF928 domain-containing protein [Roseobacter ponti]|uniref:DUF928 domain-containing protein n=1 Tax=Roseobacter ponti TaxID=1891787 RepID=A0A858SW43_9RHOB|nr:DUF928 domain-containing protein [Roseobacter ponti]QJF51873.1 DUF928 domain-containing protein [Roseobacter ponti]